MSNNVQETLDNFFTKLTPHAEDGLSNCCGAPLMGESFLNVGRCSDCLEMATFEAEL